jgi:hypothetical protein
MANKDFKVKNGLDIQTPLPVSMGGTGQTSTTNTLNSLLPPQSGNTNKVLQTDGTNTQWYTVPAAYTRGGTASRPASPTAGDLFFNTDKKAFEVWTGSAWISLIANGAVPLPPTIGTATVSGLTASVPFTGPTDFGDSAITSYTATSNPGGITASNASSPISVSGLTANTSYTFTVTATNSYGTSNASSASNSITTATTPGAPTSVIAVDTGINGEALISWTAPASNGGSAITDYAVQYSSNSGSSWTTFSDGTSTSTSATVTGLTIDTAYVFRVAAVNIIGTGSYSTASSSYTPVANEIESMDPLQIVTVGSTGTSSITFSNIPNTYKHLQIRMLTKSDAGGTTGNDNIYIRYNSDTGSNYSWHYLAGSGSAASNGGSPNSSWLLSGKLGNSNVANIFGVSIVDILDYSNTNKYKTQKALSGIELNGVQNSNMYFSSGSWRNNNAITSITIINGDVTNWVQNSQFALYGIKSL